VPRIRSTKNGYGSAPAVSAEHQKGGGLSSSGMSATNQGVVRPRFGNLSGRRKFSPRNAWCKTGIVQGSTKRSAHMFEQSAFAFAEDIFTFDCVLGEEKS